MKRWDFFFQCPNCTQCVTLMLGRMSVSNCSNVIGAKFLSKNLAILPKSSYDFPMGGTSAARQLSTEFVWVILTTSSRIRTAGPSNAVAQNALPTCATHRRKPSTKAVASAAIREPNLSSTARTAASANATVTATIPARLADKESAMVERIEKAECANTRPEF